MPKRKGHVVDRWGQCRVPNVRKFCPACEAERDGFMDYPIETYRHPDGHDVTLRVCVWRCAACRATTTTEDVPARVLEDKEP